MSGDLSVRNLANDISSKKITNKSGKLTEWLRNAVFAKLNKLEFGSLVLSENNENLLFSSANAERIQAEINVLDPQFYWFIAFGGSIGAGEAYINHYWESPDLTKVIQLFAVNQSIMDSMEGGLTHITSPLKKSFHWLNKNTFNGSKKNIVAHYDLGNEFFKQFLDPSMMYSSGIFKESSDDMTQASINKLERICQKLRLTENDHVIEIGSGWGGFAIYAAKNYHCQVTTTTISDEQYEYAKQKIQQEKLDHKITLLKKDYRHLTGSFDKLVSVEMIEAVGHQYYDTFFKQCSHLLKPNGEMLLQAITIADQRFDAAKNDVDFIKRYIFPGSCIPSTTVINQSLVSVTDMKILELFDMGVDYALTLRHWRERFLQNIDAIKQQGFDEAFIRMWEFYLCYCEGGFWERVISDVQIHCVKPLARVPARMT